MAACVPDDERTACEVGGAADALPDRGAGVCMVYSEGEEGLECGFAILANRSEASGG